MKSLKNFLIQSGLIESCSSFNPQNCLAHDFFRQGKILEHFQLFASINQKEKDIWQKIRDFFPATTGNIAMDKE